MGRADHSGEQEVFVKGRMSAWVLVLAWSLPGAAQVAIESQPDPTAWYRMAMEKRTAGLLVVDISLDGVPHSRQVKFREVRIAIPRAFAWTALKP